jgi:hypothetical protein
MMLDNIYINCNTKRLQATGLKERFALNEIKAPATPFAPSSARWCPRQQNYLLEVLPTDLGKTGELRYTR